MMTSVDIIGPSNAHAMRAPNQLFSKPGVAFIDVGGNRIKIPAQIRAMLRIAIQLPAAGRSVALDDWEPEDCDLEDNCTHDLAEYLRANLQGSRIRVMVGGSS